MRFLLKLALALAGNALCERIRPTERYSIETTTIPLGDTLVALVEVFHCRRPWQEKGLGDYLELRMDEEEE